MATATTPAPSGKNPLWGIDSQTGVEIRVPVIGLTGDYASGKTLWALSIAPGNQRTRLYDFELSSRTYAGLDFDLVDVSARLQEKYPTGYNPADLYRWWRDDIKKIESGKFAVIGCDPITDIESGLVDYVAKNYAQYNFKNEAAFVKTGGIFWSRVQEEWKRTLADLASRCETFAFTAHLRSVWMNGQPTSKKEPKGKSTLMELCSLYLWLDRDADKDGKQPMKPRLKQKLKDRMSRTAINPETYEPELAPYLPPAMPECTPAKVREYFQKPANYNSLKKAERVVKESWSEEEKLRLEASIAEKKAEAEATALERLDRQAELREKAERAKAAEKFTANQDESAKVKAEKEAARTVEAAKAKPVEPEKPVETPDAEQDDCPFDTKPSANSNGKCSTEQSMQVIELAQQLGITGERFDNGIAKRTGGSIAPTDLTTEQADALIGEFKAAIAKKS